MRPSIRGGASNCSGLLVPDTSMSIGYVGNHGVRERQQNPNANAYGFSALPAKLCSSPPVPPCADPRFTQMLRTSPPTEFPTTTVCSFLSAIASAVGAMVFFRPTIRTAMHSMKCQTVVCI